MVLRDCTNGKIQRFYVEVKHTCSFVHLFVVSEFVEEGLLAPVVPPYSVNMPFHF